MFGQTYRYDLMNMGPKISRFVFLFLFFLKSECIDLFVCWYWDK